MSYHKKSDFNEQLNILKKNLDDIQSNIKQLKTLKQPYYGLANNEKITKELIVDMRENEIQSVDLEIHKKETELKLINYAINQLMKNRIFLIEHITPKRALKAV